MANMIKLRDDVHDAVNGFNQVNIGDEVDAMWGYRELTLSASDIAHLLRGGCLYTEDGEYATVIALQRDALYPNRDKKPDFTSHTGQGNYTN